jgi:hypothetical protein
LTFHAWCDGKQTFRTQQQQQQVNSFAEDAASFFSGQPKTNGFDLSALHQSLPPLTSQPASASVQLLQQHQNASSSWATDFMQVSSSSTTTTTSAPLSQIVGAKQEEVMQMQMQPPQGMFWLILVLPMAYFV